MIGIATGVITKSGESQYGYWAIVAEAEVTKKDGGTFTPTVMCSCKDGAPAVGSPVIAQGLVQAKVSDDGKYANISLGFCRFTIMSDSPATAEPVSDSFDDEIPF